MNLMARTFRRRIDSGERELIAGLRAGEDSAFMALMDMYGAMLLRLALMYVPSRAVAEDVVQDTWIGVLKGIDRFEGRSSLKTWIMRIVVNAARRRGVRDARTVPFSSLVPEDTEAAVSPDRFQGPDEGFPGHWNRYPSDWRSLPENVVTGQETTAIVMRAIAELPTQQRTVIAMRDVHGWTAEEVCAALDLSPGNQRLLLHRARSRVRAALERHFDG
jgi:RNA polymerase sigma-70 factor, ECF subfamily